MDIGIEAGEFLEWRERLVSTQFRGVVEHFGVETFDGWFVQADAAIDSGLEGITIPSDETGERYSVSITREGVAFQADRNPAMSLPVKQAKGIIDESRPAAE